MPHKHQQISMRKSVSDMAVTPHINKSEGFQPFSLARTSRFDQVSKGEETCDNAAQINRKTTCLQSSATALSGGNCPD